MPKKSQALYEEVFIAIKTLAPDFNPCVVTTDFEKGAINAFQAVFPGVVHRLCYFHLTQSIWRNIQKFEEINNKYR